MVEKELVCKAVHTCFCILLEMHARGIVNFSVLCPCAFACLWMCTLVGFYTRGTVYSSVCTSLGYVCGVSNSSMCMLIPEYNCATFVLEHACVYL